MSEFQLVMPKMGESIAEATIIRWLKNEGDKIEADEAVLEIATDKVDSEIPTPKGGVLSKLLFKEGDVVQVGAVIEIINLEGTSDVAPSETVSKDTTPETKTETETPKVEETYTSPSNDNDRPANTGNRFYSPLVLNIAKEEGVGMSELEKIHGTGKDDRVTRGIF